ncbi:MAG: serine hydrolase [Acidobacteriota bacterium]|nr:MAG: serine hydrolase [Acidobacteriota bacterium]
MQSSLRLFSLLVVLAALAAQLAGQADPEKAIDDLISTYAKAGHFSGVVVAAKDGKVIFEKAYGQASAEHGVPNSARTRFLIASITKPMTAVVLIRAIEAGKIKLDDKLSKYVPDFPRGDEITVEMLSRHTSGLPHRVTTPSEEAEPSSPAMMVERAKKAKLEFDPGTGNLYSSTGYAVLARVLEIALGKSFPEFLEEHVFRPAGLEDSMDFRSGAVIERRAEDYLLEGDHWTTTPLVDYSFLAGAGSVFATASDVYTFGKAMADGKFGELASANFVRNGVFASNGSTSGWRANVRIDMNRGFGYALVSNLGSGANDVIIRALPDLITGRQVERTPVPQPAVDRKVKNDLSDYAGRYTLGNSGFEILVRNGELYAGAYKLLPLGRDRFYSFWSYAEISFERGEDGKVKGLKWSGSGGDSDWVRR